MKIGDRVRLSGSLVTGTIISIDPEHTPWTIQVRWSADSEAWYLKGALRKVKL